MIRLRWTKCNVDQEIIIILTWFWLRHLPRLSKTKIIFFSQYELWSTSMKRQMDNLRIWAIRELKNSILVNWFGSGLVNDLEVSSPLLSLFLIKQQGFFSYSVDSWYESSAAVQVAKLGIPIIYVVVKTCDPVKLLLDCHILVKSQNGLRPVKTSSSMHFGWNRKHEWSKLVKANIETPSRQSWGMLGRRIAA